MKSGLMLLVMILPVVARAGESGSPSGRFTATIVTSGNPRHAPDYTSWQATIHDTEGKISYTLTKRIPYDEQFPSLHIADGGWAVLSSAFEGWVDYFTTDGVRTATLLPFNNASPDHERIIKCAVGGGVVGILTSTPEIPGARVRITTGAGSVRSGIPLPGGIAGEIVVSADGKVIVAGSYDPMGRVKQSTIIDVSSGEVIGSIDVLFRSAAIDGDRILLADRNTAYVVRLSGERVGRWSSPDVITAAGWFHHLTAVVTEQVTIASGAPLYANPSLVMCREDGTVLQQRLLTSRSRTPARLLFRDDKLVVRSTGDSVVVSAGDISTRE